MPRPMKCRKVCCLPESNLFGPVDSININNKVIIMTVDEYETIRLIDLEGMMQEECAKQMDIARTTVQKIYNDARFKIANSLVNGSLLKIEGGHFTLCNDNESLFGCQKCCKGKGCNVKEKKNLKE
ncbi:DUF134 domain-containing protein [Clostridium sp.]|uniref:DUF134 domain-containing protein n=1 Tax=Clostridium sp. TaxID=1506 RepID=UPI00262791DE|nr:DUF134 domain-containing protein [Clostridium sp.]